jgi:signal transduction histidine kinase
MPDRSGERQFIHDIANPLSSALFVLDMLTEELRIGQKIPQDKLELLQRARDSLHRIRALVDTRRNVLRDEGDED